MRSHSLHRNATGSVLALLGTLLLVKCSQSSAEGVCDPPCGIGQVCTAERRCETTSTGGTAGTAGAGLGGTSSGGTTSSGGSSGSVILTPPDAGPDSAEPADGDACADVTFEVTNVVPTVVLLVDRSASMSEEELDVANPGVSRWDALKTALLDPTGAIASLEQAVRFGIVFYAGGRNGQNACPVLDQGGEPPVLMPPRTGILTDFTTYFQPLDTLPDTPTGESVAFTAAELAAFTEPGPKFIVLATDGEPDLCDDRQEPSGRERSLAEVTAAHANDITTFVISVGTDVAETHLSELANAGQGFPPDDMPAAPRFYQVTTQQALADAFQQIITGTRSCTLTLNGEIDPDLADRGVVSIDGTPVPMSETDGWRIVDGSTIELVGAACQSIQSGEHTLSASFPCEVIVQPPR